LGDETPEKVLAFVCQDAFIFVFEAADSVENGLCDTLPVTGLAELLFFKGI
jgi:hypothetical protein